VRISASIQSQKPCSAAVIGMPAILIGGGIRLPCANFAVCSEILKHRDASGSRQRRFGDLPTASLLLARGTLAVITARQALGALRVRLLEHNGINTSDHRVLEMVRKAAVIGAPVMVSFQRRQALAVDDDAAGSPLLPIGARGRIRIVHAPCRVHTSEAVVMSPTVDQGAIVRWQLASRQSGLCLINGTTI